MKLTRSVTVLLFCFLLSTALLAQTSESKQPAPAAQAGAQAEDISGMYTFLREGEFVQVTVDDNVVSGFVSRYGDADSDKGQFLDQFFSKAALEGNKLSFTTKPVHGVWFEFAGTVERGPGKTQADDGYRVLRGKLTQYNTGADGKPQAKSREVEFRSFPQDLDSEPEQKQ